MRDLVIFRAGATSLHSVWKAPRSQAPWDIYVSPYEEIPTAPAVSGVTIGEVLPGPPWAALSVLLDRWTGWRDYRYVMLADDDLLMTEAVVTSFFAICAFHKAKLAQPSLDAQSYVSHLVTLRNDSFSVRKATFVEIMMPCFHSSVLHELLWTFRLSETGWGYGLDALWPKLLGYEDLYIIDETQARHTRPVRCAYESIRDEVVRDAERISNQFVCPLLRKVRTGYKADGRVLHDGDAALLYMLVKGYDYIFQNHPQALLPFIADQMASMPGTY